ncbi:alpha/beta fold hydrolase [Kangiella japonica]|uniref:Alpha/beta fold hydrolase n=1 Tax=Kangiella japonica TaxID=647384 RepID=A0ABP3CM44_9GAMM
MPKNSVPYLDYKPPFWCQNQHFQSLLASFKLRRSSLKRKAKDLINNSQEHIIQCQDGVRLQSFYTPCKSLNGDAQPLAILIHGWEGSHQSLYLLSAANTLYNLGYSVVRLNLRDHGSSHHLNADLFHSNRLDEVVQAVQTIQSKYQPSKTLLCGFSLGGNFALRVTNKATTHNISLDHTIAFCPALDPADVLIKLETSWSLYIKYFMLKWKRSIRKKQSIFPDLYDLEEDLQTDSMRELTEKLVKFYGEYDSINDYFDGYNICHQRLNNIDTKTTIIMSQDDPIIDYRGIYTLPDSPFIHKYVTRHGGHCGYVKNRRLESWMDDFIGQEAKALLKELSPAD